MIQLEGDDGRNTRIIIRIEEKIIENYGNLIIISTNFILNTLLCNVINKNSAVVAPSTIVATTIMQQQDTAIK